jgi:ribosomal protein S27AE
MITQPSETFEAEEELLMEVEEKVEEAEKLTPTELAKVCPNCGGDPTYVEQYQRYYCYTCSEYIEPIEKTIEEEIEEVKEPIPTELAKVCPNCSGEPTYVEQYQRYYCYTCSEYVEPVEKGVEEEPRVIEKPKPTIVTKVCPNCGGEPTYVEQYQRYYCYTCSDYVEPVEKKVEEKPKPVIKPKPMKVTKVCPNCGGEPTYVAQYQRYYCYTCSDYVEPTEKGVEERPKAVAKPKPSKVAKVCPNCGGEPTYVEQYKRYYCYTCSTYVEPVQKKPSVAKCPTCGGESTYVEQYKRYYCYTCSKYL